MPATAQSPGVRTRVHTHTHPSNLPPAQAIEPVECLGGAELGENRGKLFARVVRDGRQQLRMERLQEPQ